MDRTGCVTARLCQLLGVTLFLVIITTHRGAVAQTEEVREYCEDNIFQGRCADNEVIVMKTANYGRMKLGTCLLTNYGYKGCSSDILQSCDRWCSGRPSCDIEVSDLVTKVAQPCPKDLRNYLEASYSCVKVVLPVEKCTVSNTLISMQSGFLSNYIAEQHGCGTIDLPWVVRVPKGQHINLTLYDFAYDPANRIRPNTGVCQVLAVIKDMVTSTSTTKTICNGARRVENIMTSQGNEVAIRFVVKSKPTTEDSRYHLIKFEAVGCPDLENPNLVFTRTASTAIVKCVHTKESWQVKCVNTEWVGHIPACREATEMPVVEGSTGPIPYGVSVAIILAIAMLIGAVILTVGLVIIRRRRTTRNNCPQPPNQPKIPKDDAYIEQIPYTDNFPPGQGYHPDGPYIAPNGENTYYRTWELQRHLPHGSAMIPANHACAPAIPHGYQGTRMHDSSPPQYLEHIYESPKSVRRDVEEMASESLKYYELDPSVNNSEQRRSRDQLQDNTS